MSRSRMSEVSILKPDFTIRFGMFRVAILVFFLGAVEIEAEASVLPFSKLKNFSRVIGQITTCVPDGVLRPMCNGHPSIYRHAEVTSIF
jgi:hypothetical protein